jgi:hypothetical protein
MKRHFSTFMLLKSTQKDGFLDTQHEIILCKIDSGPYFVTPNLALPKQSCASAWIFNLEFWKTFFGFPGTPRTRLLSYF